MLEEFKKFAMRSNVIDLAIGVIIGTAIGKIITSLVNDILMPPIGRIMGNVDFSSLQISLTGKTYPSLAAAKAAGAPTINYGLFLNTIIDFLIVAFVLFMVIRFLNRLNKPEAPKAPDIKTCPECLAEIPIAAKRCRFCTSALTS